MKTKICILSLCLVALGVQAQKTTKNWERVASLGHTSPSYNKVYAFGKDSVFVIGDDGVINRSTNAGISWEKQVPDKEKRRLEDILFLDSKTGFIIGDKNHINGKSLILKTENGGDSWQVLNSEISDYLYNIWSDGEQQLWICGSNNLLLYSPDKGNNWIPKTLPEENISNAFCYYRKRCYSTSWNKVWVSEDGGSSWQNITDEIPGYSGYPFMKFQVTQDRLYLFCTKESEKELLIFQCETHPRWTRTISSLDRTGIDMRNITDVFFRDPENAYILSFHSRLYGAWPAFIHKTEDAGNSWKKDKGEDNPFPHESLSRNLSFPTGNFGYALTKNNLYRSPYTGDFEDTGDSSPLREDFRPRMQRRGGSLLISAPEALQRLRIGSLEGHALRDLPLQGKEAEISLDGLPQGIYILSLETRSGARYNCKWIW